MIGTAARVGVGVGVAGRVRHRQEQKWAQQDEPQYAEQAAPPPQAAPAQPAAPDYATELEKLAQLRDQGVITTEDFEAKKKQILGI